MELRGNEDLKQNMRVQISSPSERRGNRFGLLTEFGDFLKSRREQSLVDRTLVNRIQ